MATPSSRLPVIDAGPRRRPGAGGPGLHPGGRAARSNARKPGWLRVGVPGGERYGQVRDTLSGLKLHTVCAEAHCPNVAECWGGGTATVMLMGDTCTRGCRFCQVKTAARPPALDPDEPRHMAEAVPQARPRLRGGDERRPRRPARRRRRPLRRRHPAAQGDPRAARRGADPRLPGGRRGGPHRGPRRARTSSRTTSRRCGGSRPAVRDGRAGYDQTLEVLARMKREFPGVVTKSSIMVGLGETRGRGRAGHAGPAGARRRDPDPGPVPAPLRLAPAGGGVRDRRSAFAAYEAPGRQLGFRYVASGPLVRSSYRAGELFLKGVLESRAPAGPAVTEGD